MLDRTLKHNAVLSLHVVPSNGVFYTPRPTGPDDEIWYDHDGTVCAYGTIVGDRCWLHLPGVGAFEFGATDPAVRAFPVRHATPDLVQDAFRRTVVPFALQTRGIQVLHASAVRTPSGVIALCGVKETGKSTLAFALARGGYDLWADDAVAFDPATSPMETLPLPFRIRLRPASASYFATAGPGLPTRGEPLASSGHDDAPLPLRAVFVLDRAPNPAGAASISVERVRGTDAFTSVLAHAYCFSLRDPVSKQRVIADYLKLVAQVPILRTRFGTGLDLVPQIVSEIETALLASVSESS